MDIELAKSIKICIEEGICACCHKAAVRFRNPVCEKIYFRTAICQECQDAIFTILKGEILP